VTIPVSTPNETLFAYTKRLAAYFQTPKISMPVNPLPVLLPQVDTMDTATVDGILQYDASIQAVVVSKLGVWEPIEVYKKKASVTTPPEGYSQIWVSDGTTYGANGDIYLSATHGAVTKHVRLFQWSAL